jgi:hypothetical protein
MGPASTTINADNDLSISENLIVAEIFQGLKRKSEERLWIRFIWYLFQRAPPKTISPSYTPSAGTYTLSAWTYVL